MKRMSFLNKSACTLAATKLRKASICGGLDDLDTLSEKIIVSPEQCNTAADFFETANEKGGRYFSNIISTPIFSNREIEIILQHLN
jgi:hypothetical protein|nr:hypothetical protein [Odoribacter sp. OF09-27XD]